MTKTEQLSLMVPNSTPRGPPLTTQTAEGTKANDWTHVEVIRFASEGTCKIKIAMVNYKLASKHVQMCL